MEHLLQYKIFEGKGQKRDVVRTLVRDIISIFKTEEEGEFDLPTDINEEDFYIFPSIESEFNIELSLNKDEDVKEFEISGGFYNDDKVIELTINYNPHRMPNLLYNLIGSLNEVIRHELDHISNPLIGDEVEDPELYYTQPHEVRAQLAGFRRLARIRKQPLEYVVRDWFYKNRRMHRMSQETTERVIRKILAYRP